MKRYLLGTIIAFQMVLAAETAPVATKAEFVYPDFSQCYDKNKASIVYFGKIRAVAISEKQAIAYSKEKPAVPFVKHDYLLNLYLFDSPKALMPVKLKPTVELKLGEWLESMTENSLIAVNASKIGKGGNDFFEFSGNGEVNSLVGGLCCDMYGLGIGDKFYINSETLERFISGKSAALSELGVRIIDADNGVLVETVDANFKEAKLKVGDLITRLNGKEVKNVVEFTEALKAFKDFSKVSAQVQRNNGWMEENLVAPKPLPKKEEKKKTPIPEAKKESYLQTKGFQFDNDLKITDIKKGSFAEQSGLKIGDRLMQIDQRPMDKPQEADAYLTKNKSKEASMLFDRNDFQFFVTLKR